MGLRLDYMQIAVVSVCKLSGYLRFVILDCSAFILQALLLFHPASGSSAVILQ